MNVATMTIKDNSEQCDIYESFSGTVTLRERRSLVSGPEVIEPDGRRSQLVAPIAQNTKYIYIVI